MKDKLARSVTTNILWTGTGRAGKALLQFLFILALCKGLTPEQFGAATIALLMFQLVTTLSTQSFCQALIHFDNSSPEYASTAFWLNTLLCGAVCIICIAVAPALSSFLRLEELKWLVPGMALSALLAPPILIPQAQLSLSA